MSEAVSAKGVQLYVKQSMDWKEIKEVSAVPEIGQSAEKIDVTHLTSEMKEYIRDIPDWSSDLEFTMNAMPAGVTDSNMDLILAMDEETVYEWKVVYSQLKKQVSFKGQFSYRFGAGAVSSKQDFILTIIPQSALTVGEITQTLMLTYEDGQQEAVA